MDTMAFYGTLHKYFYGHHTIFLWSSQNIFMVITQNIFMVIYKYVLCDFENRITIIIINLYIYTLVYLRVMYK